MTTPPTTERTYRCIPVEQTPGAPTFFLTAASAEEILEWCDVPRSKADYMAGYQRALSKRHEAIAEYYRTARENITPGAVIIALDADYAEVVDRGNYCELTIKGDERDFHAKLMELFGELTTRLSADELSSASIAFSEPAESSAEEVSDDESAEDDEDDVDAADKPASYLSVLAEELQQAISDYDALSDDRKAAIEDYIEGTSKPGLIIDGQHRIFGAKAVSEFPVVLPLVILPGLRHSEQVFHFYVLNSTAKPLKKTELRRIISTSLTDSEIEDLYERFDQAGVEAHEARWTFQMHTREDSVFRGLINFGFGNKGEVIPENVADQVVKRFVKMNRRTYSALIRPVKSKWDESAFRLDLFFEFWAAISGAKDMKPTWDAARLTAEQDGEQAQLFRKVALVNLQRFVLDKMAEIAMFQEKETGPFEDSDKLLSIVDKIIENLPGEFFEREWKLKQIDTSQGHEDLYNEMDKVYKARGKIDGRVRLFKG